MKNRRPIIGIIIILIGLSVLFDFPFFKILFAALIIWFGVRLMTGSDRRMFDFENATTVKEDDIRRVLVFSGINAAYQSSDFRGGEVVAVFGGGEIDLSEVRTKAKEIELNAVAVFGGLKIKVPAKWSVRSEGVGIVGGFTNQAGSVSGAPVTLRVKGVAIFGGVEFVS